MQFPMHPIGTNSLRTRHNIDRDSLCYSGSHKRDLQEFIPPGSGQFHPGALVKPLLPHACIRDANRASRRPRFRNGELSSRAVSVLLPFAFSSAAFFSSAFERLLPDASFGGAQCASRRPSFSIGKLRSRSVPLWLGFRPRLLGGAFF